MTFINCARDSNQEKGKHLQIDPIEDWFANTR